MLTGRRVEPNATEEHWHLDKRVPISLIVTLLIYGVSGLWVVVDIKKDVEVLKAEAMSQHIRDDRQDKAVADGVVLLRSELSYIRQQLDLLIRDVNARK